jgi:hypothetical protein
MLGSAPVMAYGNGGLVDNPMVSGGLLLPQEVVGWLGVVGLWIVHFAPTEYWGCAATGENHALTPVMAGDGVMYMSLPF